MFVVLFLLSRILFIWSFSSKLIRSWAFVHTSIKSPQIYNLDSSRVTVKHVLEWPTEGRDMPLPYCHSGLLSKTLNERAVFTEKKKTFFSLEKKILF